MKRHLSLATLCLITLGGISGCVDDDETLVITKFLALTETAMCIADPTQMVIRNSGKLDVGLMSFEADPRGYIAAPVVENLLPDRSGTGIQTDLIQLTGFEIQLTNSPGWKLPSILPKSTHYTVPVAGGAIPPAMGDVAALVELIPADIATLLEASLADTSWDRKVLVKMRPLGSHDDAAITGGWVEFPVEICEFCLSFPNQLCDPFQATSQVRTGGCEFQQDDFTTCCCTKIDPATKECASNSRVLCGTDVPSGEVAGTDGGV